MSFFGASQEVGRSCFLAEGKRAHLLDCGVKLKSKREEFPALDMHAIKKLDKVVLSHAHMDHSGYAPALYASGYRGKITLTKPTRDLIQILLADYLKLNTGFSPYNEHDVNHLLKNTEILEFGEPDSAGSVRFQPAGHILGAAITEIFDEKKILYTGDINTRDSRLVEGAKYQGLEGDVLIIESTYGGNNDLHPAAKDSANLFVENVHKTLQQGGKVIIPTFATGRGQEVLFILENYMRSGKLEKVPIYIDGMVKKMLKVYRHNALYLKDEIKRRILTSDDDPFKSPHYMLPQRKDRSDVFESGKCIIVTTSGMLNGGPVLSYLEELGNDPKNKLVFTGYQAEGTPGRSLLEGAKTLTAGHRKIDIGLQIERANLSGHSDQRELLQVVRAVKGLKKVFIVHGEGEKQTDFKAAIEKQAEKDKKDIEVFIPKIGDSFEL
ncbi:MAG: MBL fold metallo-hydrolase RNA specificity domain-containing protein [Candidatus Micrarchaeota archaeon]